MLTAWTRVYPLPCGPVKALLWHAARPGSGHLFGSVRLTRSRGCGFASAASLPVPPGSDAAAPAYMWPLPRPVGLWLTPAVCGRCPQRGVAAPPRCAANGVCGRCPQWGCGYSRRQQGWSAAGPHARARHGAAPAGVPGHRACAGLAATTRTSGTRQRAPVGGDTAPSRCARSPGVRGVGPLWT